MFSRFFINRPKFAIVLSVLICLAGLVTLSKLPVSLFPEISPPQIVVSISYPGANSEVVARTIGIPVEDGINGVDDMLYMESSSSEGIYSLTVTFKIGTDPDDAQIKVQNRIQQIVSQLPAEATRQGINVFKNSPDILGFFALYSPGQTVSVADLNDYLENIIKKSLTKINGVGQLQSYGAKSSMRVWLNQDRLTSLNIPANEVVSAIESQNYQPSLGKLGGAPNDGTELVVYPLQTSGRLNNAEDFGEIVVRSDKQGGIVKLKDIASIEIGAETYSFDVLYDNAPATAFSINLASGGNAVSTMANIRKEIDRLQKFFPEDVNLKIMYDSTDYIKTSIKSVIHDLFMTFLLVVAVCYLFLQNLKSTLIPSLTIPVSLLGTFAVMAAMGLSINMFTLFGLVLAIGLVVDDAIVVVERTVYLMNKKHLSAKDAAIQTMQEVSGALIATTLVLLAIFVPVTFLEGISGRIYQQFAVTISVALSFSALNALTLSPALCSVLLKPNDKITFKFFKIFNYGILQSSAWYKKSVKYAARKLLFAVIILSVLALSVGGILKIIPSSFIPDEDQGIILLNLQLPEGASKGRTQKIIDKIIPIVSQEKGIRSTLFVAGSSMLSGEGENVGLGIIVLEDWSKRKDAYLFSTNIMGVLQEKLNAFPEASVQLFEMPPVPGLGTTAGLNFQLQSLQDEDYLKLDKTTENIIKDLFRLPQIMYAYSGFTAQTPNLFLDINRTKAETMKVPLANIFSTIENYFGSGYVNDVNLGTQVNRVIIQSDWKYRKNINSLNELHIPNSEGQMVPFNQLVELKTVLSPRTITRFNQYPSASVNALPNWNTSSGEAMNAIEEMFEKLPAGYAFEWSAQSFQEKQTQGQMSSLFTLAVIFAYLFLVAQYESWSIPVSVLLSTIGAVTGGLVGILIMGIPLSIYAQLGIILLIGLAAKNAILIVEFSKDEYEKGKTSVIEAGLKGLTERYRAVLMTAATFILGVLPMVMATGAGAASRQAVGIPVFFGMLIGTLSGMILIPLFYILVQTVVNLMRKNNK